MWLPDQEEALQFLKEHLQTPNLVKHCIATQAVMEALADRLGQDRKLWGLAGLFHDIDLDKTKEKPELHPIVGAQILREKGFPEEGVHAVLAHNSKASKVEPTTTFDIALLAAEQITGLIVATALVYPSKKLKDVKAKSVRKRMKEKRFAAGVDREAIKGIEKIGLQLDEFIEIALDAMKKIADKLGL